MPVLQVISEFKILVPHPKSSRRAQLALTGEKCYFFLEPCGGVVLYVFFFLWDGLHPHGYINAPAYFARVILSLQTLLLLTSDAAAEKRGGESGGVRGS